MTIIMDKFEILNGMTQLCHRRKNGNSLKVLIVKFPKHLLLFFVVKISVDFQVDSKQQ